ncbi:MAG: 4Fe-4S dicluster domain-containing protein [Candidatus Atabeyarchaeum deiterrae]
MKKSGNVKVEVDQSKCKNPMECQKCMRICPQAVFAAIPTKIKKYQLSKDFSLFAPFEAACVRCDLCTTVCPAGAIKIKTLGGN